MTVGKRVPVYKSCRNQKFGNATETQLYLMDVERFLDALPEEPIFDLVVTSPPYNIGKEYEDQVPLEDYVAWQERIIKKYMCG